MKFGTKTASPQMPDVSGMPTGRVQYERGYQTAGIPLALVLSFFSNLQASTATLRFHHIGDRVIPPRKRREGDWIRGGLHQD